MSGARPLSTHAKVLAQRSPRVTASGHAASKQAREPFASAAGTGSSSSSGTGLGDHARASARPLPRSAVSRGRSCEGRQRARTSAAARGAAIRARPPSPPRAIGLAPALRRGDDLQIREAALPISVLSVYCGITIVDTQRGRLPVRTASVAGCVDAGGRQASGGDRQQVRGDASSSQGACAGRARAQ